MSGPPSSVPVAPTEKSVHLQERPCRRGYQHANRSPKIEASVSKNFDQAQERTFTFVKWSERRFSDNIIDGVEEGPGTLDHLRLISLHIQLEQHWGVRHDTVHCCIKCLHLNFNRACQIGRA